VISITEGTRRRKNVSNRAPIRREIGRFRPSDGGAMMLWRRSTSESGPFPAAGAGGTREERDDAVSGRMRRW